jgi:hypothetical protein
MCAGHYRLRRSGPQGLLRAELISDTKRPEDNADEDANPMPNKTFDDFWRWTQLQLPCHDRRAARFAAGWLSKHIRPFDALAANRVCIRSYCTAKTGPKDTNTAVESDGRATWLRWSTQ